MEYLPKNEGSFNFVWVTLSSINIQSAGTWYKGFNSFLHLGHWDKNHVRVIRTQDMLCVILRSLGFYTLGFVIVNKYLSIKVKLVIFEGPFLLGLTSLASRKSGKYLTMPQDLEIKV